MTTRQELILAASRNFAEHAYDGTTTRMIVGDLGISVSAIPAHFGTKENLYIAVLQRAADILTKYMSPILEKVEGARAGRLLDSTTAEAYLREQVARSVDWALGEGPDDVVRLIAREHTSPSKHASVILDAVVPVAKSAAALVGAISGVTDAEWCAMYGLTVLAQAQFLAERKGLGQRMLGETSLDNPTGRRLREFVIEKIHHDVTGAGDLYRQGSAAT